MRLCYSPLLSVLEAKTVTFLKAYLIQGWIWQLSANGERWRYQSTDLSLDAWDVLGNNELNHLHNVSLSLSLFPTCFNFVNMQSPKGRPTTWHPATWNCSFFGLVQSGEVTLGSGSWEKDFGVRITMFWKYLHDFPEETPAKVKLKHGACCTCSYPLPLSFLW